MSYVANTESLEMGLQRRIAYSAAARWATEWGLVEDPIIDTTKIGATKFEPRPDCPQEEWAIVDVVFKDFVGWSTVVLVAFYRPIGSSRITWGSVTVDENHHAEFDVVWEESGRPRIVPKGE